MASFINPNDPRAKLQPKRNAAKDAAIDLTGPSIPQPKLKDGNYISAATPFNIPVPTVVPSQHYRDASHLGPDTVIQKLERKSARKWEYTLVDGSKICYYNESATPPEIWYQ